MRKYFVFFFLLAIISLSAQESSFLWKVALPGKILTVPVERKNGELILICDDRRVYSLNSINGHVNWKIKPGGRIDELKLSLDGSIIVRDEKTIFSIYGNGEIRWSLNFNEGFDSNLALNDKGDIFLSSSNKLYIIDRFGNKNILLDDFKGDNIEALKNSLLVYSFGNVLYSVTLSGKDAWKKELVGTPKFMKGYSEGVYLAYSNGLVESYTLSGDIINEWNTLNKNLTIASFNSDEDFIISGDSGTTVISENNFSTNDKKNNFGLYYSNGLLIESLADWTIHGVYLDSGYEYYPSGKVQVFKRTITLSHKRVWGDDFFREYYRNMILDGDRQMQMNILSEVEALLGSTELLDKQPNFYEILLVASSKQNKNQDVRQEAYRIIGLSHDISFLPYLLSNLEDEKSYMVIPYIFYALGQLSIDRSGRVIDLINSKIDDHYDEKLVLNALYALYNINQYTNGEYANRVFTGIEKILNGGYSRKIENSCYDIIDKIK